MLRDKAYVLAKLEWMRKNRIWPNGLRYLWTDAFGVVLLVSLHVESGQDEYLSDAEWVVAEVDRVLGRELGIRIGEEPDRDGQYFHYLAMWLYALAVLGRFIPSYRERGIEIVKQIHPAFLVPGRGVIWKMKEDLSGPYPGSGLGALDAYDGYISYRMLDERVLAAEIADMADLMERSFRDLVITQDLGLGMMLWLSHFYPEEDWALIQRHRSLLMLDRMWRPAGHFCREPHSPKPNLPSPIMGYHLAFRQLRRCRTEWTHSTGFSKPTARATSMTIQR
jgi:hypothetical protein